MNDSILADVTQAATDAGDWYDRLETQFRTRRCEWDGQSPDGRKRREHIGREAFPWEGAADNRTRTVDEVVNEQVALMFSAFVRARITATGTESSDISWGQKVTTLLRYVVWTRMKGQLSLEIRLAANWRQWFGASVTAVMWDQQLRLMEQTLTVEGLATVLLSAEELNNPELAQAGMQAAMELVLDPLREAQALQTIMGLSPIVDERAAKRALEELRVNGQTTIDVPEVFTAEPRLTALLPMVDVYFPAGTDDIQLAPWVAHREELSETDLRARVHTHGYDEEWVEEAIEKRTVRFDAGASRQISTWSLIARGGSFDESKRDLVEIFHFYRKTISKDGIPQITCDVVSAGAHSKDGEEWTGKSEPLAYLHGKYPYVVHRRECMTRPILESRGVAEIGDTWQQEIKVQRDARTDRTSVTVLPPLIVPARRGATRLNFGPGSQLPSAGRNENYEWMRIPPYDQGSIEIEKASERSLDKYFGRISDMVPPQLTALHQEDLVSTWVLELRQVLEQILQLCQQYMTDEQVSRVSGQLGRAWQVSAAEIQGAFDLSVEADPRDLNMEMLKEKWGFLEMILKYDRAGRVDFSKLIEIAMSWLDPNLASGVLVPVDVANQKQVDEELDALNKMLVGIEPPMEPQPGMNYQMRVQVLSDAIQRNPEMQRRIAGQPDTAALVENRMKFLQFQMQQIDNAQIGRVGTGEVLK